MRKALSLLAVPLLFAAPVAAQEFEGMIQMTMSGKEMPEPMTMKMYVTESRQAMVMTMPASAGPMAGQEARMVINPASGKMTMLIPTPPGSGMPGKGMKMTMNFAAVAEQAAGETEGTVTKLGTSQTILGMKCDDYEVTAEDETMKMCVTTSMGRYTFPNMTGRGRPEMPAWTKAFGNKPAFPLKIWTDDGSMSMEVTAIERGPVSKEILDENPEGFMAMPGMGG